MSVERALKEIVVVAVPDAQILDVTGPVEVFSQATRLLASAGSTGGYRVRLVASQPGLLPTSSGLQLHAERFVEAAARPDTLMVAGGRGTRAASKDKPLIDFIKQRAGAARRVASVCTGAFLLAKAGLLDCRRATTHWDSCAALQERYPK